MGGRRVEERGSFGICTVWTYGSLLVHFGPFSHCVTPTGILSKLVNWCNFWFRLSLTHGHTHTRTHTHTRQCQWAFMSQGLTLLLCRLIPFTRPECNEEPLPSVPLSNLCDRWLPPTCPGPVSLLPLPRCPTSALNRCSSAVSMHVWGKKGFNKRDVTG